MVGTKEVTLITCKINVEKVLTNGMTGVTLYFTCHTDYIHGTYVGILSLSQKQKLEFF